VRRFLRRLRRKLGKHWARDAFFPGARLALLRWAGVRIGRDVYNADGLVIVEELADHDGVTLGDRVSLGPRVKLVVSSHPKASRLRAAGLVRKGPIVIEDDAWLGAGAVVMPGVRVGRAAVVGAGSVVTRDVPAGHVVAGQPARTVRVLEDFADPGSNRAGGPT